MEYRLGNSYKIRERGETLDRICPNCKKTVHFGVYSNLERKLVPGIRLLDCKKVYFLICPECAQIYTIDEQIGEAFRRGDSSAVEAAELKPLKLFKENINNEL